jgi:acyl carrier protein
VRRIVGRVLKLQQDGIDGSTPFGSLGLDSLMSVELRNVLERQLGSKLSATVAWNYPTVRELAAYLVTVVAGTEAPRAIAEATVVDADPHLEGLAAKVGDLSEDEALTALMGGARR